MSTTRTREPKRPIDRTRRKRGGSNPTRPDPILPVPLKPPKPNPNKPIVPIKPLPPVPPKPISPIKPDKPVPPKPIVPRAVAELEERILDLERSASSRDATSRAALGGLLLEVQGALPEGEWLSWVDMALPFTSRAAQLYIQLHLFAEANAPAFERLTPLGPKKLYLIMRVPRRTLGVLLRRRLHLIPGTHERRPLESLQYPQLVAVIAALLGVPTPAPVAPLTAYAKKVDALAKATHTLAETHPDVDPETVAALHQTLLATAAELAKAFHLPV